jgi:RNA-directed DNA polymerase
MARNLPGCPFERYADDAIVHCRSRRQAEDVLAGIAARMQEVGLRLHPDKTRIVYCKGGRHRATHEHTSFTFLGYAFRARGARTKDGRCFTGFLPAISPEALKAKSAELRAMRIHRRTDLTLDDLERWLNPIVAGWINYYGRFYRSAIYPPAARQRLPAALGGSEIQAAANRKALPEVADRAARTTARTVHPLARGPHVLGPIRRAR